MVRKFAGEKIQNAEKCSRNVAPDFVEPDLVDAGRCDVCAEAIDGEQSERKENAPA